MADQYQLEMFPAIDLEATLMGGQAFRWQRGPNRWYSGMVQGCFLKLRETAGGIEFCADQPQERVRALLESYFRLDDDIAAIHADACRDPHIAKLVQKYPGIRLLRQEPWECLVAYICSANNNVLQISRIMERLAEAFGKAIELDGETRRTFPTSAQFIAAGQEELQRMKLGLSRAPNIYSAATKLEDGSLNLEVMRQQPYVESKHRLLQLTGVGHKIADCILLFSLDKLDAFPIDRHIGRALVKYCFPDLRETQLRTLQSRSLDHFGQYAGYAGQFLFHDMRQEVMPKAR